MRIFLALLLALLIADTITGASTRRKKKSKKSKKTTKGGRRSGSRTLLKGLSTKLDDLAKAEEHRDDAIEEKMDHAVADLKKSVGDMHTNLNNFINEDTAASSNMAKQIEDMTAQVSQLSNTITGAIESIKKTMPSQTDDTMPHLPDDHDSGHDDHGMESEADNGIPLAYENIEGSVDPPESSVSYGEGEDDGEAPVAIQDPGVDGRGAIPETFQETANYDNQWDNDGSGVEGSAAYE